MSDKPLRDIVFNASEDKPVELMKSFEDAMNQKVMDAIEAKSQEISFERNESYVAEVADPKPGISPPEDEKYGKGKESGEKRFKDKHIVAKSSLPEDEYGDEKSQDAQFKGDTKKKKRPADLDDASDDKVYE